MSETVVNANTLPEIMSRRFPKGRVRILEEKGVITIFPEKIGDWRKLRGFLAGKTNLPAGVLATEEFMRQKQLEKELEL